MDRVAGHQIARRQDLDPGRARHLDQLRRAPRARRPAHLPVRRHRRPRAGDRRQRLRVWHLCRLRQARPRHFVQETGRDGRRGADRVKAALGPRLKKGPSIRLHNPRCGRVRVRGKKRHGEVTMWRIGATSLCLAVLALAGSLVLPMFAGETAFAQKQGSVLRIGQFDSPASMSVHEESSNTAEGPMMGVFNNLVLYDQHISQNSLQSIQPDLATDWSWDEDRTRLTFHLRHEVKWHDGQPFTAQDVKCTWDLLGGNSTDRLRLNPRKAWYRNIQEVITNGDYEVTFNLKRPQPALLALLASGWAPVYPCHVSAHDIRSHPIGTGPFKFGEFKPNEVIRVTRNLQYWKTDRPYLDGIEYPIIKNPATRVLAFVSRQIDMIQPYTLTPPLMKELKAQAPQAICELVPQNISRDLLINRSRPPFDDRDVRRAMALSLDRKAFLGILEDGQGDIGAAMMPPPEI